MADGVIIALLTFTLGWELVADGRERRERRLLVDLARAQNHLAVMTRAAELEDTDWTRGERDRLEMEVEKLWEKVGVGK